MQGLHASALSLRSRMSMFSLAGKTAVVTGAGSGIGQAIAVAFARQCAHVEILEFDGKAAKEVVAAIRDEIGPVAALRSVVVVPALPKTRSGKILRRTMRGIADGRPEAPPSTIEDISVLDVLRPLLEARPES